MYCESKAFFVFSLFRLFPPLFPSLSSLPQITSTCPAKPSWVRLSKHISNNLSTRHDSGSAQVHQRARPLLGKGRRRTRAPRETVNHHRRLALRRLRIREMVLLLQRQKHAHLPLRPAHQPLPHPPARHAAPQQASRLLARGRAPGLARSVAYSPGVRAPPGLRHPHSSGHQILRCVPLSRSRGRRG